MTCVVELFALQLIPTRVRAGPTPVVWHVVIGVDTALTFVIEEHCVASFDVARTERCRSADDQALPPFHNCGPATIVQP